MIKLYVKVEKVQIHSKDKSTNLCKQNSFASFKPIMAIYVSR